MSVVKFIPNCPRCHTGGVVIAQHRQSLKMQCPSCGYWWSSLPEICPDCKKPNGFTTKGLCSKCYSERRKRGVATNALPYL